MKKHTIVTICTILLVISVHAQNKLITKTGTITFEASVPSFEEVKATNSSTTAILNTATGEFAALALVRGFRFKNALMEEHFNENYAESEKYPKATFKGVITDFSMDEFLNAGLFSGFVNGELSFHGKTRVLNKVPVELTGNENIINLKSTFQVLVSDFNIEIPKIVSNKLSNEVQLSILFELKEK